MRPDVLVVEAGRSLVTNAKKRDRESALLGMFNGANGSWLTTRRSGHKDSAILSFSSSTV